MRSPRDMHAELAEQLCEDEAVGQAAVEYCLAFKAWRDVSRESNKFDQEWSPATNQVLIDWQERMDLAWQRFTVALAAALRAKEKPVADIFDDKPKRKK